MVAKVVDEPFPLKIGPSLPPKSRERKTETASAYEKLTVDIYRSAVSAGRIHAMPCRLKTCVWHHV